MAGFLCGATLLGHDPRPSVSRILLVRMPAPDIIVQQGNRYLDLDKSLTADLNAAGLMAPSSVEVDEHMNAFLRGARGNGLDQVLAEEYAALVALFDRLRIAQSGVDRAEPV